MNVADKGSFREVNMEAGKGKLLCSPRILLCIVHKKEIIELCELRRNIYELRWVGAAVSCSKKEELGNELRVKDTEVMAA